MKKIFNWQVILGIILVGLSALLYVVHYIIFRDARHIFIYMIGDIAFVFFEVLLVTLILHRLLKSHERLIMMKKLNMVIGVFFSEIGTELLRAFSSCDSECSGIKDKLIFNINCSKNEFSKVSVYFKKYKSNITAEYKDLEQLKQILSSKQNFLVTLLENQNLLEHETFTNLLWAVFHLTEELSCRDNFKKISNADNQHLVIDIQRAYHLLISEWIDYMKHLKNNYPYLFSFAIRTNPFDHNACVEIT